MTASLRLGLPSRAAGTTTVGAALRRDRRVGALLLIPAALGSAVFVFYPLLRVLVLSVQGTDLFGLPTGFVGPRNYVSTFTDPSFIGTVVTTAVFCVGVVAGRIVLGLLIAVPLTAKVGGIAVFRALLTTPIAMSVSAGSVAFAAILSPGTGLLDSVVTGFGGQSVPWLTSTRWALPVVILVTVWGSIGFTVLLLLGAFGAIDREVLEAARLDGAGSMRVLRSVSLPLITPTLFFVVVTGTVEALTTFGQIQILTHGGPSGSTSTLVYRIYQQAFGSASANFGLAAALGVVLFLLVLGLSIIQFGVLERRVHY